MTLNRRKAALAIAAASAGLASPSWAQKTSVQPVDVVKFVLFTCPICRATESIDVPIQAAVSATKGKFVFAPLPMDTDYAGRAYYAAREVSQSLADKVKDSLFRGQQDMGFDMNEPIRVAVWLQQDLGSLMESFNMTSLIDAMQSRPVREALSRAGQLASAAGVTNTPSYAFIKGGKLVAMVDPQGVTPTGSVAALRDKVLQTLKSFQTS